MSPAMRADIDTPGLHAWLEHHIPTLGSVGKLEKFAGGQSNPTYRMICSSGDYVLRRKPFGELLPSAHAVDREFRLISSLHEQGFPVAQPIRLCEDPTVIGAIFYVMVMVEGRNFWNGQLPEVDKGKRAPIYEAMIHTLAQLHAIDHEKAGLGNFGRPGNYFERQVSRWTKQYRSAQTDNIPEVEKLITWLPRTVPEQTRTSIIHGDYRIDNMIFAPDAPQVRAVLDWELATIGDPLADFAYLAMNWIMPVDGKAGLCGSDFEELGIPRLETVTATYCEASGRGTVPDLHWYFAYNLFRLTGIVQGVKRRMLDGNASSAQASKTAELLVPLAQMAWEQARIAGAPSGE